MTQIIEGRLSIPVEGGEMDAFFVHPVEGSAPGIVMLQEIFGVNDAMRAKAREFAEQGFAVVVPDLFWRDEPGVDLGYDEESRAKAFKFMQGYDFAKGVDDVRATFQALSAQPNCSGKVAIVGYCMGGKLAVLAGAAEPSASAIVAFYGVKLDENLAELDAIKAPVVLHFGDNDAHIPNEVSGMLQDRYSEDPGVQVFIYPGAQHGFFNPVRASVFDPAAAAKAMTRTLDALRDPTHV